MERLKLRYPTSLDSLATGIGIVFGKAKQECVGSAQVLVMSVIGASTMAQARDELDLPGLSASGSH